MNNLEQGIRHAAVLLLKNLCGFYYSIQEGDALRIQEGDRKMLRQNIVECIVFQPTQVIKCA